ncbi:hypothetical protein [Domibacillus enclensis]|uniref:Uncharacterized protein n=1 Tax=Domibacillus enclensis TaxID=1017273 RepID=A0A1N7C0Q9_9BACI|nr:hypothetical protein [Domibacillus enclensis]SIR57142.1 hypothetical protein SAMN05443094_1118 [Domibacillus enclensis]
MTKIDKITFVLEVVKKILELIQAGKSLNQAITTTSLAVNMPEEKIIKLVKMHMNLKKS